MSSSTVSIENQLIMIDLEQLLNQAAAIGAESGRVIMQVYNQPEYWEVQHKGDSSPLTAADLASHKLIAAALEQLTPDIPVLSEEGKEEAGRREWATLWVVDPLDGTKEFLARNDDFTVNIALVEHGLPILGILHVPAKNVTYAAAKGLGAWKIENGIRTRITGRQVGAKPRILLSRSHQSGQEKAFLERAEAKFGGIEVHQVGSAYKMCRIAEGEGDFYPRFGPTMEWDTAAAQILLEEAGGSLVDMQGKPLQYNVRETLVNGAFAVIGDNSMAATWLALSAG